MRPNRRDIIQDRSIVFITWRCNAKQFFLEPKLVKEKLMALWIKYKKRHGILIYAYVILDNHVHLVVETPDQKSLSDFMHDTNTQISKFINAMFERDSQAIRSRFYSPVIERMKKFTDILGYIFLNPYRAFGRLPKDYKYCSFYRQVRGRKDVVVGNDLEESSLNIGVSVKNFVLEILKIAIPLFSDKIKEAYSVFKHRHSIGSADFIKRRSAEIKAFRIALESG